MICYGVLPFHGYLTRDKEYECWRGFNSANVLYEGLWIGGKAAMEFLERHGTRRTHVHFPAVEDRYVLLATSIWSQWCLQGAAIGGVCMSNLLYLLSNIACLWDIFLGAPLPGFIYATRLGFTSVLVEYILEFPFFVSKSILSSPYIGPPP
jgi:hypothetical protein